MATLNVKGGNVVDSPSGIGAYFSVYGSSTGGRGDSQNTTPVYPNSISSYFKVLKCDDNWYLTPYTTNNGLKNFRLIDLTRQSYDLPFSDSWQWLKDHNFINPDTIDPTSYGYSNFFFAYKLDPIDVRYIDNSTSQGKFYIDTYNPIIGPDINTLTCTSKTWYQNSISQTYFQFTTSYDLDVADSGGNGGDTTIDATGLAPAILMIPATLIILAFFSVIYKMFMNRKMRG